MAGVNYVKHEKQPDGKVLVTVGALGDTLATEVHPGDCPCTARLVRSMGDDGKLRIYIDLRDATGHVVARSRVFSPVDLFA